jgi:hypothetical protein
MADIRENNNQCWTDHLSGKVNRDHWVDPAVRQTMMGKPVMAPQPKHEHEMPLHIRDLLKCLSGTGYRVDVAINGELYWQSGQFTPSYRGYAVYQLKKLPQWEELVAAAATCANDNVRKFFGV